MSDLVTAKTLAEEYGVRRETILRWAREGLIPSLRISRGVTRFDPGEVRRVLTEAGQMATAIQDR